MVNIKLSGVHKDKTCILDDDWGDMLSGQKIAHRQGYACVYHNGEIGKKFEFIHNIIVNFKANNKLCVDHINGNKLDNRRENLRIVNYSISNTNKTKPNKNNKNGYRNITFTKNLYTVRFMKNRKWIYCKSFKLLDDAVIDAKEKRIIFSDPAIPHQCYYSTRQQ